MLEINQKDLQGWLRLALCNNISVLALIDSLRSVSSVEELLSLPIAKLRQYFGEENALRIKNYSPEDQASVEAAIHWCENTPDAFILPFVDSRYPQSVIFSGSVPLVIFGRGDITLLNKKNLWVIGHSHPNKEGEYLARNFINQANDPNVQLLFSLTEGIEIIALEQALKNNSSIVLVLSSGPDRVYPAKFKPLQNQVLENNGLLITLFFPKTTFTPQNIEKKQCLIASLCSAVLVIQASSCSETVKLAKYVNELGREVFVVPGTVNSSLYRGSLQLINMGANLVQSARDMQMRLLKKT